jgi:Uncharacterized conserved protein related to C-terminal domain of eukaryotic chaperone, SACSIN
MGRIIYTSRDVFIYDGNKIESLDNDLSDRMQFKRGISMKRMSESNRWMRQGEIDLKSARDSLKSGNYEWVCFQAQQSAEKVVKSLLYQIGIKRTGHSVVGLLRSLEDERIYVESVMSCAQELDRHYIPSRYPDVYDEGIPHDYYNREIAERAIKCSKNILEWIKSKE